MDGDEKRHRILMVSDFFFPNFGGVESHIYYLSQCLLKLGHKVVVMTHAYGNRSGVRYVTGGLKVYYVPWKPFLMQNTLPTLFLTFPIVRFIVGGDGPKRVRLEEMREKFSLQDRVEMLGAVPHAQVRSILISGHIFLNSSLTEAFCIAILEAASCGLLTVSTRVGGVPEVLPDDMIVLAEPAPEDMVLAVKKAIDMLPGIDPQVMHLRMKNLYSWDDVAKRTEIVYDRAMQSSKTDLLERLPRCGAWAGKLFCLVMIINYLLWCLLEYLQPREGIEEVPDIRLVHAHLEPINDRCRTQSKGN
uniref:Glycosyl transferase family 1 domain-containing protein n=1 Tax=Leersia perrieri TaxID=77586 RepID=A0A0D9XMP6_9ORYZ